MANFSQSKAKSRKEIHTTQEPTNQSALAHRIPTWDPKLNLVWLLLSKSDWRVNLNTALCSKHGWDIMNHLVRGQIKVSFPKFYFACACLLKADVATSSVNSSIDRNIWLRELAGWVYLFSTTSTLPFERSVIAGLFDENKLHYKQDCFFHQGYMQPYEVVLSSSLIMNLILGIASYC